MTVCHLDLETRSVVDLRKAGMYRYAEDPTTECWLFCWSMRPGMVETWWPGLPDPVELLEHVRAGGRVVAHNAGFERTVWNRVIRETRPWPELTIGQMDCTKARARVMGLPGDLERAARIVQASTQKDMAGKALIERMWKPRAVSASCPEIAKLWREDTRLFYVHRTERVSTVLRSPLTDGEIALTWWYDDELHERGAAYCRDDVRSEEGLDAKLPPLTAHERRVWELDQRINDRGVQFDMAAVDCALKVVETAKAKVNNRLWTLTGGAVTSADQHSAMASWIASRGIPCDSVAKDAVGDLKTLAELWGDPVVAEALDVRGQGALASVAKLGKAKATANLDGRARGMLEYHGAGPGRWAGRGFQPQNIKRLDSDRDLDEVRFTMGALRYAPSDATLNIELGCGSVVPAVSKAMRAFITAKDGRRLLGGDFSNIEGRIAAWIAGEHWKIEAFRDYDLGLGDDLYKKAYAQSFGVKAADVTKAQRQVGKVQELAGGYQGSVGAYLSMGAIYNVKAADLARIAFEVTSPATWDATASKYAAASNKEGLDQFDWTGVKVVVDRWRAAHPRVVQGWWDVQDAAILAMQQPGVPVPVLEGHVHYLYSGAYLFCQLPSGRVISYPSPELRRIEEVVEVVDPATGETYERVRTRTAVRVWHENSLTKQWSPRYLYGGLQFENIVQGAARCVLDNAMLRCEDAGYTTVLTVHDECLWEEPIGRGSVHEVEALMSIVPAWASGLPLAAKCWEDERYVK